MPPLDRTFALEQMHDVAVRVAEDLDLDVPGTFDVGLDEQRAVAKGRLRLLPSRLQQRRRTRSAARTMRIPRPPPPAEALIEHRPAERLDLLAAPCRPPDCATSIVGSSGTSAACIRRLASIFEPIAAITVGRRTDERDARCLASPGELRVLRQKAVAGMNRVRAGLARAVDDRVAAQIRLCRPRAAERHDFVGLAHERRVAIGIGADGHRGDAHLAAGAHDPPGDLAAIGDQNLLDGRSLMAPQAATLLAYAYIRNTP